MVKFLSDSEIEKIIESSFWNASNVYFEKSNTKNTIEHIFIDNKLLFWKKSAINYLEIGTFK